MEINNIKNWNFVTGTIRSGTTFVGSVLSLPCEVDYIHEPFNPQCGIPGIKRWYPYIRPSSDTPESQEYYSFCKSIFDYSLTLKNYIPKKDKTFRKVIKYLVGSRGVFYLNLAKLNPFRKAAIIKDPTGNLLTEYLYLTFGVKPVIVIKHPLSFIASLKRVNWWPHLGEINDQPHLIEDYFLDDIDFITTEYSDLVSSASAYWRAVHKVLLAQASKYPDWQIITHEELSQEPVFVFKHLYEVLNLPWSESVKSKIIKLTQGNRSAQAKTGLVQDFRRNSRDIFKKYRDSLSKEQRFQIFEIVKDVALQIYSRESFNLD